MSPGNDPSGGGQPLIKTLQIRTADNEVRRVELDQDAYSLGRAHTNDLCYAEDASLSRKHVVFERDGQSWSVTDLGSKNGTVLNGARITGKQRLQAGDRLVVGQLSISCMDPTEMSETNVVFVPGAGPELNPAATVMTSLEGLLSGESTGPDQVLGRPDAPIDPQRQFQLPVVRTLIQAGRELAGHQPLEELFKLILDLSIDAVTAERGVLMTLQDGRLVPKAVHGEGFRISTTVRDRVMQQKTSLLVRDVAQEEALLKQVSISEQQIHSLMAVPLQTQDDVIGLIYVDSRLFVREFTPNDLNLLTVLANVAAIRIDHEQHLQLQQQEHRRTIDLEQAAEIQTSILPKIPPAIDGLDLAGHNAPCRTVGGDYYDFIPFPGDGLALVLGDVAGKGMSAALLMSSLQARVQLLTEEPSDLCEMVSRLDRSVSVNCPSNRFITFFMLVIYPATGEAKYCNAGHNPAFLVRASGEVETLSAVGTVLGVLPELGYEEQQIRLEPGDLIAVYSDGVTEAANSDDEEFGEQRLSDLLVAHRNDTAAAMVEVVTQAVDDWCDSAPPTDDITLIVARRTG